MKKILSSPTLGIALFTAVTTAQVSYANTVSITGTDFASVSTVWLSNSDTPNPGVLYSIANSQGAASPLMRFDLSSLSGQQVSSNGTLQLTVDTIWPWNILTPTLNVFALNSAYDPTTATYNNYGGHGSVALDTQIPTFDNVNYSVTGQTVNFTISMSVLQSWIDSPNTNFGLFLDETDYQDWQGHSDIAWQSTGAGAPSLSFSVAHVPEPSALMLFSFGILSLGFARRFITK